MPLPQKAVANLTETITAVATETRYYFMARSAIDRAVLLYFGKQAVASSALTPVFGTINPSPFSSGTVSVVKGIVEFNVVGGTLSAADVKKWYREYFAAHKNQVARLSEWGEARVSFAKKDAKKKKAADDGFVKVEPSAPPKDWVDDDEPPPPSKVRLDPSAVDTRAQAIASGGDASKIAKMKEEGSSYQDLLAELDNYHDRYDPKGELEPQELASAMAALDKIKAAAQTWQSKHPHARDASSKRREVAVIWQQADTEIRRLREAQRQMLIAQKAPADLNKFRSEADELKKGLAKELEEASDADKPDIQARITQVQQRKVLVALDPLDKAKLGGEPRADYGDLDAPTDDAVELLESGSSSGKEPAKALSNQIQRRLDHVLTHRAPNDDKPKDASAQPDAKKADAKQPDAKKVTPWAQTDAARKQGKDLEKLASALRSSGAKDEADEVARNLQASCSKALSEEIKESASGPDWKGSLLRDSSIGSVLIDPACKAEAPEFEGKVAAVLSGPPPQAGKVILYDEGGDKKKDRVLEVKDLGGGELRDLFAARAVSAKHAASWENAVKLVQANLPPALDGLLTTVASVPAGVRAMARASYKAVLGIKEDKATNTPAGDEESALQMAQNVIVLRWINPMVVKQSGGRGFPGLVAKAFQNIANGTTKSKEPHLAFVLDLTTPRIPTYQKIVQKLVEEEAKAVKKEQKEKEQEANAS